MPPGRVFTLPLSLFLVLVAAVLGYAAVRALARPDLPAALRQLADGDCERQERLALVRLVLVDGLASADRADRLPAAMAAVLLDRRADYDRCLGGDELPLQPADAERLPDASLGEPVLRALLAAMLAERAGDAAAARDGYRRVLRQCKQWNLPLAAQLAGERLQRLE